MGRWGKVLFILVKCRTTTQRANTVYVVKHAILKHSFVSGPRGRE